VDENAGRQGWDFSVPDGRLLEPGSTGRPYAPKRPRTGGASDRPVLPPARWLLAAAGCVVAAFALGSFGGPRAYFWVLGWLVGGFVSIGLIAAFTLADSRRRADPWYTARPVLSYLRTALLALAIVAVALNAWRIADWASRR
jgi:hypothetical protein